MAAHEEEKDKGFVVRDRRRFGVDGATAAEAEAEAASAADESAPPAGAARAAEEAVRGGPKGPNPEVEPQAAPSGPRPIDFTTFVFSLGSSALMHLGDAPHPETGKIHRDLALAKETIDLLAMLREKTRGNLTPEEDHFLGALLYDLRVRFVEAAKVSR